MVEQGRSLNSPGSHEIAELPANAHPPPPCIHACCRESKQGADFQSIEQMANFIDNLSDYNHAQGVTYKHVTLMSELSRIVEHRLLMQVRQGRADHNMLLFGGGGSWGGGGGNRD